jgi:pyruvate formate lyase activating enzyme
MIVGKPMATTRATIFNVQRFSIHDGPGIRTTVFFKGCPLRCRWCQNPESLERTSELAFYADRCQNSGACISACPQQALSRSPERVDRQLCDGCGQCVDHCAFSALQLVGRDITVDELMNEIVRDRPFYAASGGGVTLSGGEATLWLEFVVELATACRDAGIGVLLQTCGGFRWQALAPHLDLFANIHFDLKLIDNQAHREFTGADNRNILANARHLAESGRAVEFRMPIIPGYTDGEANLGAVASFLAELDHSELTLLTYHAMGQIKSERLGWPLPALSPASSTDPAASVAHAADLLTNAGLVIHRSDQQ